LSSFKYTYKEERPINGFSYQPVIGPPTGVFQSSPAGKITMKFCGSGVYTLDIEATDVEEFIEALQKLAKEIDD